MFHPREVHQVNSAYQEAIREILGPFWSTRKTRHLLVPNQTPKLPLCYPSCFSRIAVRASSPQQHPKPSQYSPTSLRNWRQLRIWGGLDTGLQTRPSEEEPTTLPGPMVGLRGYPGRIHMDSSSQPWECNWISVRISHSLPRKAWSTYRI